MTLTPEEREIDLDKFHQLYSTFKEHKEIVCDTVSLLNREIRNGKRILVEDSSSTSMDIDTGIYPFTDSFNTTTGAVCTGLGVPEEVIETSIGAFSAISVIDRSIYNRIKYLPTEIDDEGTKQSIAQKLEASYDLPMSDYTFGWTDLNLVKHAETTNQLSSLFLTHLDLLDDLE